MADSAVDAGARAIGADADIGFAWSGRRRWCRRRSSAASYRVIGNDRKFRSTDSGAALTACAAVTRAREAAPIPARSEADRPAPAGSAALRLLPDVDSSFSRNCCWQLRRRTLALGRSAPMLTSASPDRAAAMVPAPIERSELPGHRQQIGKSAALSVAALTACAAVTRAREAAPIPARSEADRPAPAGWVALRLLADVDSSFSRNCCWQIGGGRWRSGDRRRC